MKKERDYSSKATPFSEIVYHNKNTKNKRVAQLLRVRNSFMEKPKSMREVTYELGEERENICRYVAMLRYAGQINLHHKGQCKTTKHTVGYYTTDPQLFRKDKQLSFFDEEVYNG